MAEPIEMSFWMWIQMSPRKHALDGGAHWRHLVNTIEPSMCGSDVAFFSNYLLMFAIQSLVICYCRMTNYELLR